MQSLFEIVGPVMIGPSSSHTAGAARLAKMARYILADRPVEATMTLYGSFAKTYKGHGTDKALLAGLLGMDADDARIPQAYAEVAKDGMAYRFETSDAEMGHPNVVKFNLRGATGREVEVIGRSLGGGRICITDINKVPVEITGESYTLLTFHQDRPGVVAQVTQILAKENINISAMRVFGRADQADAVMCIDMDGMLSEAAVVEIGNISLIDQVMNFEPL